MKPFAIFSGLLAVLANSEIVTIILLLIWTGVFVSRLIRAAEERGH